MAERKATVERNTLETQITVTVNLDGTGQTKFKTGVPFLEHMLDQVARHGMLDLDIKARGDLHIDAHHTVEDIGITLGQAMAEAAGECAPFTLTVGGIGFFPAIRRPRVVWIGLGGETSVLLNLQRNLADRLGGKAYEVTQLEEGYEEAYQDILDWLTSVPRCPVPQKHNGNTRQSLQNLL